MANIRFHIVLKQPVLGKYFIFKHLRDTLEAYPDLGDFDEQELKDTIDIHYYTNYEQVANRFILGFSVDLSMFLDEDKALSEQDLDMDYIQNLIRELGNSYKSDDKVEGITRFEDAFILEEALLFYKEVFEIEMKIREVLSYILTYNFSNKDLYDWIGSFNKMNIANPQLQRSQERREAIFNNFMENELFHVVFTQYGLLKTPKKIAKIENLTKLISLATNFLEFKTALENKGITNELNEEHKRFIGDLATNLIPIEQLRNEIMHNREIKDVAVTGFNISQRANYQTAKTTVNQLIIDFWQQEETYQITETLEAEAILDELFKNLEANEENDGFNFQDLDNGTIEVSDLEELKDKLIETIEEYLTYDDDIEVILDLKLDEFNNEETIDNQTTE